MRRAACEMCGLACSLQHAIKFSQQAAGRKLQALIRAYSKLSAFNEIKGGLAN